MLGFVSIYSNTSNREIFVWLTDLSSNCTILTVSPPIYTIGEKKPGKKQNKTKQNNSGLQRDSKPWPPRIPVRSSTNWAMKPHIGSQASLYCLYFLQEKDRTHKNYLARDVWLDVPAVQYEFIIFIFSFYIRLCLDVNSIPSAMANW